MQKEKEEQSRSATSPWIGDETEIKNPQPNKEPINRADVLMFSSRARRQNLPVKVKHLSAEQATMNTSTVLEDKSRSREQFPAQDAAGVRSEDDVRWMERKCDRLALCNKRRPFSSPSET